MELDSNVSVLEKEKQNQNIKQKEILSSKNKRDIGADAVRVIACIIVIATHLTLTTFNAYEVQVDWSRLFTKCFLCDGVGLFFFLTGFFISNGRKYGKVVKNALKKVVLPSFLVLVFGQLFKEFIINQASFLDCLKQIDMGDLNVILSAILHGEVRKTIPVVAHLWYIFAYIQIIILFPVLQLFCKDNEESNISRRIVMILCFLSILLKDIQKFAVLPNIGEISMFTLIDEKIFAVFLGYELFLNKDKIKSNKKCTIFGMIGFFVINFLRYRAEMQYMINNKLVIEGAFNTWDCTFGIISALCLFIAIYSIDFKNEKLVKIISYISSMTFGIYLVHFLIIAKIDIYKFEKISTAKFEILYMLIGTITIFLLSFIIVFVVKKLEKCIGTEIQKIKNKK